jgi:hypothetical protein
MSLEMIAGYIFMCLFFPWMTYTVTQRRSSEILEACERNENLKKNAGILSKEEAKAEFGVWILPHKQNVHLCAEFISRVIKPILLLSVIEMICIALSLLDVIPGSYDKAANFIMLGCLLIQFVICIIHMFKLNNACRKMVTEHPAEDGQNVSSD